MLNWLILYCLIMSFLRRLYYHRKVISPSNHHILKWLGGAYIQGVGFVVLLMVARAQGVLGPGYSEWWATYSTDHSMILWTLFVPTLTLAIYIAKQCTYFVSRAPGNYKVFEGAVPSLYAIDMTNSLIWNVVFWVWFLFAPWLPFLSCFVRVFLFKTPTSSVFPYA